MLSFIGFDAFRLTFARAKVCCGVNRLKCSTLQLDDGDDGVLYQWDQRERHLKWWSSFRIDFILSRPLTALDVHSESELRLSSKLVGYIKLRLSCEVNNYHFRRHYGVHRSIF